MKRKHKILIILLVVSVTISLTTVPAFALTESEVQDQVNAVGKESVTGNLFVWFLCAIAFLKVSQKIDSFMSSLGINVGHTGGSMCNAEAYCRSLRTTHKNQLQKKYSTIYRVCQEFRNYI